MSAQSFTLRPEHELLLCCARTGQESENAARIRFLAGQKLDWPYFRTIAQRNRVVPLVFESLRQFAGTAPAEDLEWFRSAYCENAGRNLFLGSCLVHILATLEAASIPAIPIKGPVLAVTAYGNLALRQIADLDILVCRVDLDRAIDVAVSNGYRWNHPSGKKVRPICLPNQYHCTLINDRANVIELHSELTGKHYCFPLSTDELFQRTHTVRFLGSEVRNLSPEDLLVYLCMHGAKHSWSALEYVCSVAEVIRNSTGLDWEAVERLVRRLRTERIVALGLRLSEDLLGIQPPRSVGAHASKDRALEPLVAQVKRNLFLMADKTSEYVEAPWLYMRSRERFADRLRYCALGLCLPDDEDVEALLLPGWLAPLYWAIRPPRVLAAYWASVIKHTIRTAS